MGLLLMSFLNLLALKGAREAQRLEPRTTLIGGGDGTQISAFHLYRSDNSTPRQLTFDDCGLPNKNPIKLIIPDAADAAQTAPWIADITDRMAARTGWNVIAMDWRSSAGDVDAATVDLMEFVINITRANAIPIKSFHLIGHGLGVAVAIQAAAGITQITQKQIARVTGLDPTIRTPGLTIAEEVKKCAKFVDMIHTNGGHLGILEPIGHVDFYPNGGKQQTGCDQLSANAIFKENEKASRFEMDKDMCSHVRACQYWSASIANAHAFRAFNYKQWMDYVEGRYDKLLAHPMGIAAHLTQPWGPYFLECKPVAPHVLPYLGHGDKSNPRGRDGDVHPE